MLDDVGDFGELLELSALRQVGGVVVGGVGERELAIIFERIKEEIDLIKVPKWSTSQNFHGELVIVVHIGFDLAAQIEVGGSVDCCVGLKVWCFW